MPTAAPARQQDRDPYIAVGVCVIANENCPPRAGVDPVPLTNLWLIEWLAGLDIGSNADHRACSGAVAVLGFDGPPIA